jgi:hypothetical protein
MQLKIFIEKSIPFISVYGLKESMESIGLSYKIYEVEKINILKLKEPILIYSKKNNYNKLKKLNLSFVYVPFEEDDVKLKKDLKNIKDIDNIKSFFVKDNHFSSFKKIFVLIDIFSIIGVFLSGNVKEDINPLLMRMPFINSINKNIEDSLTEIYSVYDLPFVTKYFWPNSYNGVLVLTHDVDYVDFPLPYILSLIKKSIIEKRNLKKWLIALLNFFRHRFFIKNKKSLNIFENLIGYISLEEKLNARSSFYFICDKSFYDLNCFTKKIKKLQKQDWEICLHSTSDELDLSFIEKEKREFESIFKNKIFGIRKHNLNAKFPGIWLILNRLGFSHDSSFGFSNIIGSRAGFFLPYSPAIIKKKKKLGLIEIPLNIMDTTLFHTKYMNLDSKRAFDKSKLLIDEILKYNGMCVLLWHNQSLDEEKDQTNTYTYKLLLEYAHKKNIWLINSKTISDWWFKRSKIKVEFNKDKNVLYIRSPFNIKGFTVKLSLFNKGIVKNHLFQYDLSDGMNEFRLKY